MLAAQDVNLDRLETMCASTFIRGSETVYSARLFLRTLMCLGLGIVCCSCELLDQKLSTDAFGRFFDVEPRQARESNGATAT
ncbi:uncharacterized protein METZ01_LOCUS493992, partial [marine metagenome]